MDTAEWCHVSMYDCACIQLYHVKHLWNLNAAQKVRFNDLFRSTWFTANIGHHGTHLATKCPHEKLCIIKQLLCGINIPKTYVSIISCKYEHIWRLFWSIYILKRWLALTNSFNKGAFIKDVGIFFVFVTLLPSLYHF